MPLQIKVIMKNKMISIVRTWSIMQVPIGNQQWHTIVNLSYSINHMFFVYLGGTGVLVGHPFDTVKVSLLFFILPL